jgi:hypothetical protein
MAADEGFDKIIPSPRYMDSTTEETITNLSQLTKKIGFGKFSSVVVLAVGNELTVDARGIYPGFNYWERVSQIEKRQNDKTCQKKLEGLLRDLISAARANTDLDLTYAAGSWEWMMPWDDLELDILGDNHYWYKDYGDPKDPENDYMKHIEHYRQFRKPYFITEFGSGPCVQAFDRGGWRCSGISSTYGTEDGENAQARDIETYMGMFNMAHDTGLGMDGCFMFDYYDRDSQIVDTGNPATASRPRKAFYMYKSYQRAT